MMILMHIFVNMITIMIEVMTNVFGNGYDYD